uniref:Bucky ball n=1 Tax=Echeneis naucrates TaxID=173247 RepID=A0A665WTJ0_ECHNA
MEGKDFFRYIFQSQQHLNCEDVFVDLQLKTSHYKLKLYLCFVITYLLLPEDGGKQTPTFGSGQQRTHHPRPFFYVQPPSQPYFLYQHWQLNNPYSHYGLPGGFNFGRPCMHPYQYMQYPGFVFPHAPIYPVDYRRMFEPRFPAPTWGDMPRHQQQQQQYHHPQPHGRRETACSEAQTEPSDAITKLIECLDKIRANELQGAERELDSGVASQSSGMFSPGDEKKNEEPGHVLPSMLDDKHLESSAVTFSDSTMAVYDGETSQRSLDTLSPQGCWSGALEEELPLDSSSVHENCPELEEPIGSEHFLPLEEEKVTDIQTDFLVTEQSVHKCDAQELMKPTPSLAASFSSSQPLLREAKSTDKDSKAEHQLGCADKAKSSPKYQILKLPFESILTSGAAGSRLSSPSASYHYNYLPIQTTHERMSVLSPSLDELSSRDEMFSTDLEDVDLFPKNVYTGRRLSDVVGTSPQVEEVEEVWLPGSKMFMCACCGKSLAKGAGRSKVHSSKMYRDEAGDSDEESRKPHSLPPRHAAKLWYKRGQYNEPSDQFSPEEGHDLCKQDPADCEVGDMTSGELQCRTCQGESQPGVSFSGSSPALQYRLCREDMSTLDQDRWADGGVIPRRRQAAPRQEMSTQRKVMYHRPRDEDNDDDEAPPSHWERGGLIILLGLTLV